MIWTSQALRKPQGLFFAWKQIVRNQYFMLQKAHFPSLMPSQKNPYRILLCGYPDYPRDVQVAVASTREEIHEHWGYLESCLLPMLKEMNFNERRDFLINHVNKLESQGRAIREQKATKDKQSEREKQEAFKDMKK